MGSPCPRYFPSSPGDFGGSFNIPYHFKYCPTNPSFGASPRVWRKICPICSQWHPSSKLFFTRSLTWDSVHRNLCSKFQIPKLIFFTPIFDDGRRGLFPLWDSSQSFSFCLLLPLSGDSLGLLYVPIPHSLSIWSQSANICWLSLWPTFFTFSDRPAEVDLHYYPSF